MANHRTNRARRNRERRKRLVIASVAVVCLIFGGAFLLVKLFLPAGNTVQTAQTERTHDAGNASGQSYSMETKPFQSYGTGLLQENTTAETARTVTGAVTGTVTDEAATDDDDGDTRETTDTSEEGASAAGGTQQRKLSAMTLEEKVAQLFFITPEALTGYQLVTQCGGVTYDALRDYPVGGLIYFSGNLENPDQTKQMLSDVMTFYRRETGMPLFTGIDEEGGRVVRVAANNNFNVTRYQPMGILAESGNADEVYNAGAAIGAYLNDLGFNVDFAPVADVLTNPDNTAIGDRSFGSDKDTVSEMAKAFAQGLRGKNVLPVYKHFPGHGGTEQDTHEGYAYTSRTLDELRENELVPFARGIGDGIGMIMVAHISLPQVTGDDTPATLSKTIVTDILRNEMGFEGVVITDALNMGAVSNHYTTGESAVLALQAGCDMLLMPSDFRTAYQAVIDAVRNGTLSEAQIDRSVLRILNLKQKLH